MRKLRTIAAWLLVMMMVIPSNLSIMTVSAQGLETENRNIAKLRAVYQSSSANFNNTGQLVTDGILSPEAITPVITRQWDDSPSAEDASSAFDGLSTTKYFCHHPQTWVQYQFPRGVKYSISSYTVTTANDSPDRNPKDWALYGVTDDDQLEVVDTQTGQLTNLAAYTARTFNTTQNLGKTYKAYRLTITANNGNTQGDYGGNIQFAELDLLNSGVSVITKPSTSNIFSSYWQSATASTEWVYIDLGGPSKIDGFKLVWGTDDYASNYDIQVSDNASSWTTVYSSTAATGGAQNITLQSLVTGKYVRLLAKACHGLSYMLYEFEVLGDNDVEVSKKPQPPVEPDGRKQFLTGGNWKLQRASEVNATGPRISSSTDLYDDSDWIAATVPGTVLVSYLNNGAIPDPNFGMQTDMISESYFLSDFWYRDSFLIDNDKFGQEIFLNFNNINWKADVYFNGTKLGDIKGAFIRGKFNVTGLANYGGENVVAVYIYKNDNPGATHNRTLESTGKNGGDLGRDNPTIHATVGWDWVPTVRGRDIGIYGDVFLTYSGAVQLADPWIETHLKGVGGSTAYNAAIDPSTAYLTFRTEVSNSTASSASATVSGTIMPGNITYSKSVDVGPGQTVEVEIDDIEIPDPNLWWPNRYGDQFLYLNETKLEIGSNISDIKSFRFGVRELRTSTSGVFNIFVNGARIYCSGGNWGMDESMLRCNDAEGYDIRVRLHKEAGFTMIRNWVGMTGNEEFYNACDKYGILIMDDFWLANPGDGPNPNDFDMFMANAFDKIKWVRKHPSLAFYCGRNEGQPYGGTWTQPNGDLVPRGDAKPYDMNTALREACADLDGTRKYVASSAHATEGVTLSGYGPYTAQGPNYYYQSGNSGNSRFHSERGLPNVPSLESIKKMIPEDSLWPVPNIQWAYHDFTINGAQNGAQFMTLMRQYGEAGNVEDFVKYAQMVNYENHKALFEGPEIYRSNAMLMWMSQSAWPSFVWQTYDYFFDTNAGYFGIKKANQIVNAIYNPDNRTIVVVNNSGINYSGLRVEVDAYDLYGKKVNSQIAEPLNLGADEAVTNATGSAPITSAQTTTDTNFIVTRVYNNGELISDNFYWMTFASSRNFLDMKNLDMVALKSEITDIDNIDGVSYVTAKIKNANDIPALMIRIKTLTDVTGQQVLPAYYSDNYFSLMPDEETEIIIEFDDKHLLGEEAEFFLEGYNIAPSELGADVPNYRIGTPRFIWNESYIESMINGEISLEVGVTALEDSELELYPIIALYYDNKLVDVQGEKTLAVLGEGDSVKLRTKSIVVPSGPLQGYSVKGFLWDGNMTPLRQAISLGEFVEPSDNILLKKPASANGYTDNWPPEMGNDGNTATRWSSAYSNNQPYVVNLRGEYQIEKVSIEWESARAATFQIQIGNSPNGPWTTLTPIGATSDVINGTGSQHSIQTINFPLSDPCSYFRFYGLTRNTNYGFSFWEIEAYGVESTPHNIRINPLNDRSGYNGIPMRFVVSANGSAGTGIVYSADDLPEGAAIDPVTGVFTWTPTDSQLGVHNITFIVTNGFKSDQMTVMVTIGYDLASDTAPPLWPPDPELDITT
jgi:hypothetical protein